MVINTFKSHKIIVFVILIAFMQNAIAQENNSDKNEGKVRIILTEFGQYNLTEDTCIMSIYQKEKLIKKINLSELLTHKSDENIFNDFYINEETYTVLIENLAKVPVLFVNVNIKKNKMNFLPINVKELQSIKSFKGVLIKDYSENLKSYIEKNPPVVR